MDKIQFDHIRALREFVNNPHLCSDSFAIDIFNAYKRIQAEAGIRIRTFPSVKDFTLDRLERAIRSEIDSILEYIHIGQSIVDAIREVERLAGESRHGLYTYLEKTALLSLQPRYDGQKRIVWLACCALARAIHFSTKNELRMDVDVADFLYIHDVLERE